MTTQYRRSKDLKFSSEVNKLSAYSINSCKSELGLTYPLLDYSLQNAKIDIY